MRKLILAVGLTLLVTSSLSAQVVPKGNVFLGYSFLHMTPNGPGNMNGWEGSLEGKVLPFVGLVVDLSGNYKTNNVDICLSPPGGGGCAIATKASIYNALIGPRVSFSVHGVRPFAHALFGVAHDSLRGTATDTNNSFATAIGGGVDFKLAPIIGWRIQADALRTSLFGSSNVNLRASTGLVLRF